MLIAGAIAFFLGMLLELVLPKTKRVVVFHWITFIVSIAMIIAGLIIEVWRNYGNV